MVIHNADKILFSKIYFAANNHKESTLAQEEIQSLKPSSSQESPQDSTKISIKNKLTNDSKYQLVMFEDSINGNKVQALLSKENIQRLQEKFDKSDFYTRDDSILRLNGKAESYVSGWYGEIAYNMGAFNADLNKDGKFSPQENALIRDDYNFLIAEKSTIYGDSINIYGVESYIAKLPTDQQTKTIDDFLDELISKDIDLNGKVTLKEDLESTEGSLYTAIKNILDSQVNPLENLNPTQEIKNPKQKVLEEISRQEAMTLLAKIKQNGNLESLSQKEKEALQKYFSNEMQRIKQEKNDLETTNEYLNEAIQNFSEQIFSKESLIFETKA